MQRLLAILFLFATVSLNGQQVFYDATLEYSAPLPIDTAWCRAHAIDKIGFTTHVTHGKRFIKGRRFLEDVACTLKNGVPDKFYYTIFPDVVFHSIAPTTLYKIADFDTAGATFNPDENSYKSVRVLDTIQIKQFYYAKAYFDGEKPLEIIYVTGTEQSSIVGKHIFTYNVKGHLASIIATDEDFPKKPVLIYKVNYINGIADKVYENDDHGRGGDVYVTCLTYYSKGKKVKLK